MLIPTDGTSASMKHGMKSVIFTAKKASLVGEASALCAP